MQMTHKDVKVHHIELTYLYSVSPWVNMCALVNLMHPR